MKVIFEGAFSRHPVIYNFCIGLALYATGILNPNPNCDILYGSLIVAGFLTFGYYVHKSLWITFGTFKSNGYSPSKTIDSIAQSAIESAIKPGVDAIDKIRKDRR